MDSTKQLMRNLELAYNYLAFVALPLPDHMMMFGNEILQLVTAQDKRNFFEQLRRKTTVTASGYFSTQERAIIAT
jgi:hypothetical protein